MSLSFISSVIRLRVLPLTIVFLCLLLMAKVTDLVRGTTELSDMLIASPAIAKSKEDKPAEPVVKSDEVEVIGGEKPEEHKGGEKKEAEKSGDEKPEDKRQFSQIEVDILQSLSARREEIAKWEEEVRMKENLLEATELRINKKIEEIKVLEGNVRKLLDEYSGIENSKIASLVKIYENMKPKSAAQIFDEMDMPILLLVIDKMSERKAAPILAGMDPKKAKEVTVELAEQRKVMSAGEQALGGK